MCVCVLFLFFVFLQELNTRLLSGGDVLLLSPVSRRDSGIYQSGPLEEDSHEDVKAEIQLTVHCKKLHSKDMQTPSWPVC